MITIDARGRRCPLPVLDLARRVRDAAPGEELVVEADDPAARSDVPAWCRMRGHVFVGERTASDGTPAYVVRKGS